MLSVFELRLLHAADSYKLGVNEQANNFRINERAALTF